MALASTGLRTAFRAHHSRRLRFNTVRLKPGVDVDDLDVAIAEMCSVAKETYGGDKCGFIAGQVFRFSGFVSDEGSLGGVQAADHDIAIVTYWRSFDEHERSHADAVFRTKYEALASMSTGSRELRYELQWQGAPELEPGATFRHLGATKHPWQLP